jgi:hypothetical protein
VRDEVRHVVQHQFASSRNLDISHREHRVHREEDE